MEGLATNFEQDIMEDEAWNIIWFVGFHSHNCTVMETDLYLVAQQAS